MYSTAVLTVQYHTYSRAAVLQSRPVAAGLQHERARLLLAAFVCSHTAYSPALSLIFLFVVYMLMKPGTFQKRRITVALT